MSKLSNANSTPVRVSNDTRAELSALCRRGQSLRGIVEEAIRLALPTLKARQRKESP